MTCLVLVGYRACGKTTVGERVAAHLGFRFVDLDALIEAHLGTTIRDYFSTHGEGAFRAIEHKILQSTLETPDNLLLSTGGGCVLLEENRGILREKATLVIYIEVAAHELQRRLLLNHGDRPSLSGRSVVDEVPHLLAQREALYRAVAQQVVDGNAATETVIARVLTIVENLD
jgi:shikimate kinase